jgi:hypothetical protein
MKIKPFIPVSEQMCTLKRHSWSVARLFQLSKELPVMDVPLEHLNLYIVYEKLTLREMVMHIKAVADADLSFPIILDEDGELMDGCHRIMRALLEGAPTIKAVRFESNPPPCQIKDI